MTEQLKVLIIDDSAQVREFIIEYLLKPNDFAFEVAQDGLAGLNKALAAPPDLILLDYELPRLNGNEVLRRLRNHGLKTPVILMTSHGSEQLAVEVFLLGVQNYLIKPFNVEEALQAIREALQITHLEREKQELVQRLVQTNRELKYQLDLREVMVQIGKSITLIHPSKTLERIVDAALFLTHAEEGLLFLINPRTGQLSEPLSRKKPALSLPNGMSFGTSDKRLTTLSVPLENGEKTIGTLSVKLLADQLKESELAEYEQMLRLLAGYANIALQNLGYLNQIQAQKEQEKQLIRGVFERYVDAQVVEELLKQPNKLTLGGNRQPVSVLFADLRGFSTFARKTSPEETVDTINAYIGAAVEAILKEKGTLDKFVGDAVMAFFNAPLSQPDHVLRAVRAALLVKQAILETQKQLSPDYQLDFGIGICAGEAVVGNVGTARLMNYTVIGDSVNKAKRLQENAKGGQILISQETLDLIQPHIQVKQIGWLHLKGQAKPEPVYEVIGLKPKVALKAASLYPTSGLTPIAI